MAQALSEPIYEINPECTHYKDVKFVRDARPMIAGIIDGLADEYDFKASDFVYYSRGGCGFFGNTESKSKFEKEVLKNGDRNGIHLFKKNSKIGKEISEKMKEVHEIERRVAPFGMHDIVGLNNVKYTQWVGDRFFVEVNSVERVKKSLEDPNRRKYLEVEPIMEVDYKEYLKVFLDAMDDE